MSLWMVRAGRYGEQENTVIENNVVAIGWNELSDLSKAKNKDELKNLYKKAYPDEKQIVLISQVSQIWRFLKEIKVNDLVALPLKTKNTIQFGIIKSDYQYKIYSDNVKHIRAVEWIKEVPRTEIDQDLLYSFGSLLTVCQIKRNNAEKRIKELIGLEKGTKKPKAEEEAAVDIDEYAKDQITKYINQKFKGHGLARLVDAILKAQGYTTKVSPPGPDGGVDILASGGMLGFDEPRICVQVKSTSAPVNVNVLRELRGVMSQVNAKQGLLVSWGGFNNNAFKEAKDHFFTIRLWDSKELLNALFRYYDKFSDELKAELPLKRIWALVLESE
jgi:restriction system protein